MQLGYYLWRELFLGEKVLYLVGHGVVRLYLVMEALFTGEARGKVAEVKREEILLALVGLFLPL